MAENNANDRSKLVTERHILTDRDGIPYSSTITSANKCDTEVIKVVINNAVLKHPIISS